MPVEQLNLLQSEFKRDIQKIKIGVLGEKFGGKVTTLRTTFVRTGNHPDTSL